MKSVRIILLLFLTFIFMHFKFTPSDRDEAKAAENVKNYYRQQLGLFKKKLNDLNKLEKDGLPEDQLLSGFLETRKAFKRSEALLCYLNNFETKKINGPNIVTNEYTQLTPYERVDPHGLQVIESLIYNPTKENRQKLKKEIELLQQLLDSFIGKNENSENVSDKDYNLIVWDALRYSVYRVESMGITGFDVPDSKHALPETTEALKSLKTMVQCYKSVFNTHHSADQYQELIRILNSTITYVNENSRDFDSFNRLLFIREYLHPLSAALQRSVMRLNYNYPINARPVNNAAEHLFSLNAFNMDYFEPYSNPEKKALGKKLFSDPILSFGESRSCASCHIPDMAFSDGLVKNTDMSGKENLLRNTPTLLNTVFQTRLFYDSRAVSLEKQALNVIHNKQEMGGDIKQSVEKLKTIPEYQNLFKNAYPSGITGYNLLNAISCYVGSLVSFNSRFDQYIRKESDDYSDDEKNGFNLFYGKAQCATCHFAPLFNGLVPPYYTDTESEILGVPADKTRPAVIDADEGRYSFSKLELHRYAFKISGIRNVELTAPYMHNGVFSTLEEVVEFYANGGGAGQGMHLPSQTLSSDSLKLSKKEIQDIVLFMKSLTDTSGKY